MTPEERFDRIENAIRDLITVSRTVLQTQERTSENIDALVEHQQAIDQKLLEMMGRQESIDQKLAQLLDTVNRLGLKIDQLSDGPAAFLKGFRKLNGQE